MTAPSPRPDLGKQRPFQHKPDEIARSTVGRTEQLTNTVPRKPAHSALLQTLLVVVICNCSSDSRGGKVGAAYADCAGWPVPRIVPQGKGFLRQLMQVIAIVSLRRSLKIALEESGMPSECSPNLRRGNQLVSEEVLEWWPCCAPSILIWHP